MKIDIDMHEQNRLVDLLHTYRDGVDSGDISGYDQSKEDELTDIDDLIKKLWEAQFK